MTRSVAEALLESAKRRTSVGEVSVLMQADSVSKDLERERLAKAAAKQARIERVRAKEQRDAAAKRQHDSSAAGIARIAKGGDR